jgi:hypothetical protein
MYIHRYSGGITITQRERAEVEARDDREQDRIMQEKRRGPPRAGWNRKYWH